MKSKIQSEKLVSTIFLILCSKMTKEIDYAIIYLSKMFLFYYLNLHFTKETVRINVYWQESISGNRYKEQIICLQKKIKTVRRIMF